jgi:hypothetical protein
VARIVRAHNDFGGSDDVSGREANQVHTILPYAGKHGGMFPQEAIAFSPRACLDPKFHP